MTETAAERRNKIMSLTAEEMPCGPDEMTPPPLPPGVEEATEDVLASLSVRESLETLEKAGRYSKAKWKIQVWIRSDRSVKKPIAFTVSVWESGKRLHGGGDESTFFCRRNPGAPKPAVPPFMALGQKSPFPLPMRTDGCGSVIPAELSSGGRVMCPHCGIKWDVEHIGDSIFYRQPVEVAATTLTDWFRRLDGDADIYVKYSPEDIRVRMMAVAYGIREAQRLKGLCIYSLQRIVADTAGGASLESRFKALLLA